MMAEHFTDMGYAAVRQLPDGRWIGVMRFIYTVGLCVGLDDMGYRYRYCYQSYIHAVRDAERWDGQGDPPGLWLKLKGHPVRGDVMGPGWEKI